MSSFLCGCIHLRVVLEHLACIGKSRHSRKESYWQPTLHVCTTSKHSLYVRNISATVYELDWDWLRQTRVIAKGVSKRRRFLAPAEKPFVGVCVKRQALKRIAAVKHVIKRGYIRERVCCVIHWDACKFLTSAKRL